MSLRRKYSYQLEVVSSFEHHSDLRDKRATMEVTSGGEETSWNIRPCRMRVRPNGALNMNESHHLTIGYLLTVNMKDLELKSHG